jgi:hypothetical protein
LDVNKHKHGAAVLNNREPKLGTYRISSADMRATSASTRLKTAAVAIFSSIAAKHKLAQVPSFTVG